MYLPKSWADGIQGISIPANAAANGMYAWHAGTNAWFARSLGLPGTPFVLGAGLYHESPLNWGSFKKEQEQGPVNHFLDSSTDILANLFGATVGYSKLSGSTSVLVGRAAAWSNYIPGPGETDRTFGGRGDIEGIQRTHGVRFGEEKWLRSSYSA